MTAKEIKKTEFKEWGKKFWQITETILKNSDESPQTKTKVSKIISSFCVKICSGSTFALEILVLF